MVRPRGAISSLNLPLMAGVLALAMGVVYYATSAGDVPEQAFWVHEYPGALGRAEAEGKLVFMDVYADWCGPCRKMATDTFTDARVQTKLQEFIPLKIDADADQALASRYNVQFLPSLFVLNASGEVIGQATGYHGPDELLGFLQRASERH